MSMDSSNARLETATLGGGCFWCLEAVFLELEGVVRVESGYSGGSVAQPTYEQVSSGRSGHAEVVQITFDPASLTYRELLEVFFAVHDPTTLNRQGADVGPQYRSVIFSHSSAQQATAQALIAELTAARTWSQPIVTELATYTAFYPADEHHQEYYRRNGQQPYCRIVIAPKLAKFRAHFPAKIKA